MSGGSHEYLSAFKDGSLGSSGFTSDPVSIYGEKYFDKYPSNSTIISFNKRILGDATGELGPIYRYILEGDESYNYHNNWYADYAYFFDNDYPWLRRGGVFNSGILAGQLNFHRFTGAADYCIGFRIIIT
jgi:hypothetical protein